MTFQQFWLACTTKLYWAKLTVGSSQASKPQLAVKLECMTQAASTAAARHANNGLVNQTIVALYQHPQSHDHVVDSVSPAQCPWGQHCVWVDGSLKQFEFGHNYQFIHECGAMSPVTLPLSLQLGAAQISISI